MSALTPPDSETVDRIVSRLRDARSILFVTGAGMSADSGLPTYRGVGGLYNVEDTAEGLPIEVLLSGEMFATRPEWTWKYLRQVEEACRGATFNRGHAVLAEMERHFDRVWTLTQNVDGFHHAAGSRHVIDIHGDLHDIRCTKCPRRFRVVDYSVFGELPRCPECSAVLRPDVVLFGEYLRDERLLELKNQLHQGFDLTFSIGTTSVFPYIRTPVELAVQRGKPSIEINPGTTPVSRLVTYRLAVGAAVALDAIWTRFRKRLPPSPTADV
jgi:NAD-dependent deacetylase